MKHILNVSIQGGKFLNLPSVLFSSNGGLLYYRYTDGQSILDEANTDAGLLLSLLDSGVHYNATLAIVITYFRQTYFGGSYSTPVRPFSNLYYIICGVIEGPWLLNVKSCPNQRNKL